MNKTPSEARELVQAMKDRLAAIRGVEKVLCPPFVDLVVVSALVEGTDIGLGAQNLYPAEAGAYTGEISPLMVRELCRYVILGHSERRGYFGETDGFVNQKVHSALKHGLVPIICVGEDLEQNERGETERVVSSQVRGVLSGLTGQQVRDVVIAYEPIWAIGTGRAATAEGANRVIADVVRATVAELYGSEVAQAMRVQYGGSMNAANSRELLQQPDIDGGLIGGASLKADEFVEIVRIAAEERAVR
ncbi:MAG: triose-phosphate isomerase [Anaerolineae bacterium]|nr:triose-phosphate isomerase [Anaerolineae bacterium]